jgi:predicted phage terminase large subunit-like protein
LRETGFFSRKDRKGRKERQKKTRSEKLRSTEQNQNATGRRYRHYPRLSDEQRERLHADVRELYVKFRGKNLDRLAAEMRRRGHTNFYRHRFYEKPVSLIEKLKLKDLLTPKQRRALVRIGSRSRFRFWLEKTEPRWTWNQRFQIRLLDALEAFVKVNGPRRLMIFMPPRHGKSEMVTVRYTAWRLECNPKLNIILGSYNQRLANKFSRKIKRIVAERVPLAQDRRAVDEWETAEGGGVKAIGVGSGVTGYGAGLIMIDDPIKGRSEAESKVIRDKTWEWYTDDIYTRLEPRGAVVLIQTRWHEDDLAGRLQKAAADGGDKWDVVSFPAIAEADDPLNRKVGQALWPKRFNVKALERIRQQQGSYSFNALYQQRPTTRDGNVFKREWFEKVVASAPQRLSWARGYDLAVSTRSSADYTASFRCAFDDEGNLYIADGFRRRIEYPEQRRYVTERVASEDNTVHGIEKALHGQALVQDLRKDARLRGRTIQAIAVDNDKFTRALAWAALAEEGRVRLVEGTWIDSFVDEICSFPDGAHDDQVDAVSLAVRMLRRRKAKLLTF